MPIKKEAEVIKKTKEIFFRTFANAGEEGLSVQEVIEEMKKDNDCPSSLDEKIIKEWVEVHLVMKMLEKVDEKYVMTKKGYESFKKDFPDKC